MKLPLILVDSPVVDDIPTASWPFPTPQTRLFIGTPKRIAAAWRAAIRFGEDFPQDKNYLEQLKIFEACFSFPKLQEKLIRNKPRRVSELKKASNDD